MNYRVLTAAALILLLFLSAFMWLNIATKEVQLQEAEDLSSTLRDYFRATGERCSARPGDYFTMNECLIKILGEYDITANVVEKGFQHFDVKRNQTGYIIVINEGRNPMDSSKFQLLLNREMVDNGCQIPGAIDPSYTCRLEYNRMCEKGDVLEVVYDGQRAHLRNC